MTWNDGIWIAVIVGLIGVSIFEHRRKKRIHRQTIKNIMLTPNDWALLRALANRKRMNQSTLISDILKQHLNKINY